MRYLLPRIYQRKYQKQAGFTLLELMIALAIFAVMAMMGWQIMDALTKSRDRAKVKIATLRALQYAYENLAQDLAQTSNAIAIPPMASGISSINAKTANLAPTFVLNAQGISFVRAASPDPRLTTRPTLSRIGYSIVDNQLIKTKLDTLLPNRMDNATTSVLLNDVTEAKWTALTPNAVATFPDASRPQTSSINNSTQNATIPPANGQLPNGQTADLDVTPYQQLPNGIELQFTYQQIPIMWRFALPAGSPTTTGLNPNLTGGK